MIKPFKVGYFTAILCASLAFAQEPAEPAPQETAPPPEESIKFQIPTDESGAPAAVILPAKPDTVQKLGIAQNLPLNLNALSAKEDTTSFETYSKRYALVKDSIAATYRKIEQVRVSARGWMLPLEPKGEFEKQAEFDARQNKWNNELAQRMEKETKSLNHRLGELKRAETKILEHQASLYGSVEIKSNPAAASIWIGREEIGATPAEYRLLIPGNVKITVRKEGYNQWDTTFKVNPGAKLKINTLLNEKSIFSQENEINFAKLLAKDTDLQGYRARIQTVNARKAQVAAEFPKIQGDFPNQYPPLDPKKPAETPENFKKRQEAWAKEGMRQYAELQKKSQSYNDKLNRSLQVLNDHIAGIQSAVISETAITAKVELGAYDAEKEIFEITAQDIANEKSPFIFKGKVGIPLNTAKTLDRNAPGFAIGLQFINYPFVSENVNVNLAMSKLQFSKNGQNLKTEGSFAEIERYKSMEGYSAWKMHADSLLNGTLKQQGLNYRYAMTGKNDPSTVIVDKCSGGGKDCLKKEGEDTGTGLGWRGWTRIVTLPATAALGALAVINKDDKKQLATFGGAAGGCALVSIITFVF